MESETPGGVPFVFQDSFRRNWRLGVTNETILDFPGGPLVKTLPSNAGGGGQSLVRELRSPKPWG